MLVFEVEAVGPDMPGSADRSSIGVVTVMTSLPREPSNTGAPVSWCHGAILTSPNLIIPERPKEINYIKENSFGGYLWC